MNGLDGLRYISSNSAGMVKHRLTLNSNKVSIQISHRFRFKINYNLRQHFYEDVQRQGVRVTKSGASFMQVVAFTHQMEAYQHQILKTM